MAKKTVDLLSKHFFDGKLPSCTTLSPISGGKRDAKTIPSSVNMDQNVINSVTDRYGSNANKIFDIASGKEQKATKVVDSLPYIWAEVDYLTKYEHVHKISDLLLRRTQIYHLSEDNGLEASQRIAKYIAELKGLDDEWVQREVEAYSQEVNLIRNAVA